jgi:hypothetical protein
MSPLLFSSLRQSARPALRQRVRFNSSTPPDKKAQELISNAQKNAGELWSSAAKKAEEVVGCLLGLPGTRSEAQSLLQPRKPSRKTPKNYPKMLVNYGRPQRRRWVLLLKRPRSWLDVGAPLG